MKDSIKVIQLKNQVIINERTIDSLKNEYLKLDSTSKVQSTLLDSIKGLNETLNNSLKIVNKTFLSSGEEPILGMSAGLAKILIPVFVTIGIFGLGQFLVWFKSKSEKQNEVNSYRELILTWIKLIEKSIKQQVDSCNDFSARLSKSVDIHPEIFKFNKLLANKVDDFSVDVYVNTFITNTVGLNEEANDQKEKWCFNLISHFNFLKDIEEQIPDIYEKYHSQTFKIMDEWNANFTKLDKLISQQSKLVNVTPTLPTAKFHSQIMTIANSWRNSSPNGRSSASHSMDNLITPMTTAVSNELNQNPSNDYAFNLSDNLQSLRITFMKWESVKNGNVQVFEGLGKKINEVLTSLNQTGENFRNNTKVNDILQIK